MVMLRNLKNFGLSTMFKMDFVPFYMIFLLIVVNKLNMKDFWQVPYRQVGVFFLRKLGRSPK